MQIKRSYVDTAAAFSAEESAALDVRLVLILASRLPARPGDCLIVIPGRERSE